MSLKEFTTAAEAAETAEDEGKPFTVDGRECRVYQPSSGQMAVLLASVSRTQDWTTQIAGIINFFVEVLDESSNSYIVGRLLDRTDPFGLDEVQSIIEWMVEDWTGRPMPSPSVSTPSRRNGGRKSTQPTPAST
jgi:hypothetical protein